MGTFSIQRVSHMCHPVFLMASWWLEGAFTNGDQFGLKKQIDLH